MRRRPRTALKKRLRERRCPKCGAKLNPQRTRCGRCTQLVARPRRR